MTVPVHGLPFVLCEGMEAFVVPPSLKGPRSLKVSSVSDSETGQLVAFKGVWDINTARELVGRSLLVREADLPEGFALRDVERLLGRTVVDVTLGELGRIEEVMRQPAHDVWVVRSERGEVLVPAVGQFVYDMEGEGPITVDLPHGLVSWEEV